MHKHTHTCTHKHAHARTHARTHTHSHTHAHTHTHTHTHAHTHTHTLSISQSHSPDRRITHTLPRVFDPQECVWGVCFMWSCICAREKRFLVPQRTCTARTPKLSIPAPSTRPRSCFRRRGACTQHRMFVCVQRPGWFTARKAWCPERLAWLQWTSSTHFAPRFLSSGVRLWRLFWLVSLSKIRFYTCTPADQTTITLFHINSGVPLCVWPEF